MVLLIQNTAGRRPLGKLLRISVPNAVLSIPSWGLFLRHSSPLQTTTGTPLIRLNEIRKYNEFKPHIKLAF